MLWTGSVVDFRDICIFKYFNGFLPVEHLSHRNLKLRKKKVPKSETFEQNWLRNFWLAHSICTRAMMPSTTFVFLFVVFWVWDLTSRSTESIHLHRFIKPISKSTPDMPLLLYVPPVCGVYACVHTCPWACRYWCGECVLSVCRGQRSMSGVFPVTLDLDFWVRASHWTWDSVIWLDWLASELLGSV